MKQVARIAAAFLLFAGPLQLTIAEPETLSELQPKDITVGVHINQLLEVNFAEDYFIIDFWLWFRWTPTLLGEFDLGNYSPVENYELIDAQILHVLGAERDERNGFIYENARVIAKVSKRFEMKSYPVDSHVLTIKIEDQNHRLEKIRYVADSVGTTTSENLKIPGWLISPDGPEVITNSYKTNFGNADLPPDFVSEYTQFQYRLEMRKPIALSILKSLWPTFIATMVAILALFLNPKMDSRYGLTIGSLFAIVANKLSITSGVQDAVQFGFSDIVQLMSGLIILFALIESVIAHRLAEKGISYDGVLRLLDIRFSLALVGIYVLMIFLLVLAYT